MQRRKFIQKSLALTAFSAAIAGCRPQERIIPGSIIGASSGIGHLLREHHSFPLTDKLEIPVLIVGAGISGLSAARWLSSLHHFDDYLLVDLESEIGGNARHGTNQVSSFPWGAHYVPIANNNCKEYLEFLHDAGIIEYFDQNGLPFYSEEMLCNDPQDRLYINGLWQEGLVPQFGIDEKGEQEINRFMKQMETFRNAIGEDGKEAFSIPISESSRDEIFQDLDKITMEHWMKLNGYENEALHWYINYCTKDDFGTNYNETSAWAGIHYFAGRKGKGVNAHYSDVLTWPEGNGFLVEKLRRAIKGKVETGKLTMSIRKQEDKWVALILDVSNKTLQEVHADKVILSTPQFVNARLLNDNTFTEHINQHYQYCPWMVANITVGELSERSGSPASWDNVLYTSESLGYVDATHQLVDQIKSKRNLTYYHPLTKKSPSTARKEALERTHASWCQQIIKDLSIVHQEIGSAIENIDIMLWGHAMIQPRPGVIHGGISEETRSLAKGLTLAHTDMSGISIFEEAFYQGILAAKAVIDRQ